MMNILQFSLKVSIGVDPRSFWEQCYLSRPNKILALSTTEHKKMLVFRARLSVEIGRALLELIGGDAQLWENQMTINSRITKPFFLLLPILLAACGSPGIGVQNSQLKPCPTSPNCVSTEATPGKQQISPFKIKGSVTVAWEELQQQVGKLPRTQIITVTHTYLHAECRSALFRFIDDLEFLLQPEQGIIAIRSAARIGYSDFGVNRKRVETLRAALISQGVIE